MTDTTNPMNAPEAGAEAAQGVPQYAQHASVGYVPPAYQPAPQVVVPQIMALTGGQKFGWFVVGFLGNIIGMLLAWLVNVDKAPQVKSDAIKFAVIGFVVAIVLEVILFAFVGVAMMAAMGSVVDAMSAYPYYY